MGDMRETLVDVSEAFSTRFEEKKLPVLQVTKFDMIGETNDTTQVRVLNKFSHCFYTFSIFTEKWNLATLFKQLVIYCWLLMHFDHIDYWKGFFFIRNLIF